MYKTHMNFEEQEQNDSEATNRWKMIADMVLKKRKFEFKKTLELPRKSIIVKPK